MEIGLYVLIALVLLALVVVKKTIVIIPQSETKIIERLGRYYATLKPGINIIIPFIDQAKTIVAVTQQAPEARVKALEAAGVEIIRAGSGAHVDLKALLQKLGEREICSVFVEGGGSVNFSLLEAGLVDKVYAFIAPKFIGGREALTPVEGEGFASLGECVALTDVHVEELAGDILLMAYTKR